MTNTEARFAVHADHAKQMDTDELRKHFLAESLFADNEVNIVYSHYERMMIGGIVPTDKTLTIDKIDDTGTDSFLDRREAGIVNIGETGTVSAGGEKYEMEHGDVLYLGMGSGAVSFEGKGRFYLTSAPAHRNYPTRLLKVTDAEELHLGSIDTSNKRTIRQFIHPLVMESCQLVLGYTTLLDGSVWNTMPCHQHDRRMEAYLYCGMDEDTRVMHFMGELQETRHLVIGNEEAALSPPWSIHSGVGTGAYTFIWAMAGDNIDYTDMDHIDPKALR